MHQIIGAPDEGGGQCPPYKAAGAGLKPAPAGLFMSYTRVQSNDNFL
jgi:hypothetical protein